MEKREKNRSKREENEKARAGVKTIEENHHGKQSLSPARITATPEYPQTVTRCQSPHDPRSEVVERTTTISLRRTRLSLLGLRGA
jgi:hypothetical protein